MHTYDVCRLVRKHRDIVHTEHAVIQVMRTKSQQSRDIRNATFWQQMSSEFIRLLMRDDVMRLTRNCTWMALLAVKKNPTLLGFHFSKQAADDSFVLQSY